MNVKIIYIVLAIIFFMAGLVNLTFPDKVMITLGFSLVGSNIYITSTHIGAVFLGLAIIFWLARLSAYPKLSTLGRMSAAIFLTIIIFLIIAVAGIPSNFIWLVSIIAIIIISGASYLIIIKQRR